MKTKNQESTQNLGSLLSVVLIFSCLAVTAYADKKTDTDRLRSAVKTEEIMEHLEALQKIANKNGGNRAIKPAAFLGPNGDQKTRDYIVKVLTNAGLDVQRLPVVFENFHEATPAVLELVSPTSKAYIGGVPGAPTVQFTILTGSGSGDFTTAIQAVDIKIPLPPEPTLNFSTSGCESADFADFVPGNIALIQRGTCSFTAKVKNAQTAGASGVIIFNEGQPGRTVLAGGLLNPADPVIIPAIITEFAIGEELYNLSLQGPISGHIKTDAEFLHTVTENIIAETRTGRPDHVVMVGAHLDSVEEGPGINDNGSGIATLLEIAKGMQEKHILPLNRVRFAFWGGEEAAQAGSVQYVDNLSPIEAANIALYLNVDMLGSPNYVPSVYETDYNVLPPTFPAPGGAQPAPDSPAIEKVLVDYFESVGPTPTLLRIDQRSDYREFLFTDIPFAAITSGFDGNKTAAEAANFGGTTGQLYDACYHKACDTIHNVSRTSLKLMSGAVIHTLMTFANREVIFP